MKKSVAKKAVAKKSVAKKAVTGKKAPVVPITAKTPRRKRAVKMGVRRAA